MANAFTDPSFLLGTSMDSTVEAISTLLSAARSKRVPVVYAVTAFAKPPEEIGMAAHKVPALAELQLGTRAVEIDSRLEPQDGDFVIVKKYWSSFMMTNLLPILIYRRIDTLIISGNSTSGCVRAAATDALCYGYRPIVPVEAVTDRSEGPHRSNLFDINAKFADVLPIAKVLKYLDSVDMT
jgi:nicotinamidase-related amidase